MKVIIECDVDNSVWGDADTLMGKTDAELIEAFLENPHDLIIEGANWTIVRGE